MWYIESSENENRMFYVYLYDLCDFMLCFCSNAFLTVPEDTELVNYRKPGFLSKFIELNQVMWNTNKGLTDSHPYDSRPNVSICLATFQSSHD